MPETITLELHKKQYEAFMSKALYTAVICGSRGGKTYVGSIWAQTQIQQFPQGNGLIAAPTYPILRQATLDTFFGLFPQYRKYYKEQKSIIELPTGGKVFIRSTDEALTSLEGMTLHWAWGDEFGLANRLAWIVIRGRLATTGGKAFITTTPYFLNYLYEDIYLPWQRGLDKDIAVYNWASIENPYFPMEFAEKERKRLSPQEFDRRYLGKFSKMTGLVYDLPPSHILEPNAITMNQIQGYEATIAGLDFGFHQPAQIVLRFKAGIYYVIDEYYESEQTDPLQIRQARLFQSKYFINEWFADPENAGGIQLMKEANLPVTEANKEVLNGISYVKQLINERRLFVLSNCKNFIDEINSYHYPESKDGKAEDDKPVKLNDHLMDALRYALYTYKPAVLDLSTQRFNVRVMENRARNRSFQ